MAAAPVPIPIHLRKSRRVTLAIALASSSFILLAPLLARVPIVPAVPNVQVVIILKRFKTF
jgi:hypothetical protein